MEELVLAIPTDELWHLLPYKERGLIKGNSHDLERIVNKSLFRERSSLEGDPSFKQLIPYAIITNKGSFFMFKRTSGQRESRLHNKLHLGVGGHMNPGEPNPTGEEYIISELKRELFEELNLLDDCTIEKIGFIGFINDESIPVSRVHTGLLYCIHLSNKSIAVKETNKMSAGWVNKAELQNYYEEMETWTQIAIDHYISEMKKHH